MSECNLNVLLLISLPEGSENNLAVQLMKSDFTGWLNFKDVRAEIQSFMSEYHFKWSKAKSVDPHLSAYRFLSPSCVK